MKKLLLYFFFIWVFISNIRGQMLSPFIDQLVLPPTWGYFYWPGIQFINSINGQVEYEELQNGVWQKTAKQIITQDAYGNFTNYKWFQWDPTIGDWEPALYYEASTEYNSQGQLTYWKYWGLFEEYPVSTSRNLTYNASGQYASITGIDSMNYGGMWMVGPIADEMMYDGNGRIAERWVHVTDPTVFNPGYKINISYTGSGLINEAIYQTEFFGITENWLKFVYSYNSNGSVTSIYQYGVDDNTGEFFLEEIDSLLYPNANTKVHIQYFDDGYGTILPDNKGYFYYDNSGNLLYVVSYYYENGWVKDDSIRYFYSKGRPESSLGYKWQGNAYSPEPYQKGTFSNYLTGIEFSRNFNQQSIQFEIYPNPVQQKALISGVDFTKQWEATLYQSNGKLIRSFNIANQEVDFSDLRPGLYVLKLMNGQQIYTSRFIKK